LWRSLANDGPVKKRRKRTYKAGYDGYLTKPVDVRRFSAVAKFAEFLVNGNTKASGFKAIKYFANWPGLGPPQAPEKKPFSNCERELHGASIVNYG